MIQVLVVEDSHVIQELLVHILRAAPEIQIAGRVNNGAEALEFLKGQKPDVITMDIHMPRMDGLEATRQIMETQPVPIIIVSANWNPDEVALTFQAMEAGAVALVEKPRGLGHPDYAEMADKLVRTVKAMSEVHVIRRWPRTRPPQTAPPPDPAITKPAATGIRCIAVGASTGGPPVLNTLLSGLPKDLAVPVLIVQHIAAGFVKGLADWLGQTTGWPVIVAVEGQEILPGHAYLAPDDTHMGVDHQGRIALSRAAPESGLRPSVAHLFRSVVATQGARAIGVLLTGMGRDGAEELKRMRDAGAVTIAQDQQSSVVHGMPGEAIKLDAAVYILPPEKMPAVLTTLVNQK
ncbi:MAG: chemotaxis-specific protein-glutamate methyltransferase CheB [Armatimonadota bacterium]|nr:chemotaxis-specific protein-glutamate methyltransferase CheB [Armatimonadota bacterium]